MSRLKPVDKVCLHCSKKYTAKRSDAKFCSDKCRATASTINRVKPLIVAETMAIVEKENRAKYDAIVVPDEYKKLVSEYVKIAKIEGNDWYDRCISLYQKLLVDDAHHGYNHDEAMEIIVLRIESQKKRNLTAR